ncbi:MAG: CDP-alcohol phosphatidyltransferase family protein [Candidatus Zixiibacteriota bacterium]
MQGLALGRFWTVPNMLSLSRIALLPPWWLAMSSSDRFWWNVGGAMVAYAILSDVLDGWIARRFNQSSGWGHILDPVGDKLGGAVVGLFCVMHREMGWLPLVLVLGRDAVLMIGGLLMAKRTKAIPGSINLGRVAALLWGITLMLYAFDWQPQGQNLLWPAVGVYLAAGVVYVISRLRFALASSK